MPPCKRARKKLAEPPTTPDQSIAALADDIRRGERRALARAITLVESTRPDHQAATLGLLDALLPDTGKSIRLGVSGIPGAGKSTFIEALGLHAIAQGLKVAVLAIDPSSQLGGGSLLGDKTRMELLSRSPQAYIRPSPTSGALGGITRRTREAILVCEAAGFDLVIVETVGVGQSETAVADLVDMFLLLLVPAAGDELQGLKKGIIELADLVIVNKCDGDLRSAAGVTAAQYTAALHLLRPATPHWTPHVVTCSALEQNGIDAIWDQVVRHRQALTQADALAGRRAHQAAHWLWDEIGDTLRRAFQQNPRVAAHLPAMEARVMANQILPGAAAKALLADFLAGTPQAGKSAAADDSPTDT